MRLAFPTIDLPQLEANIRVLTKPSKNIRVPSLTSLQSHLSNAISARFVIFVILGCVRAESVCVSVCEAEISLLLLPLCCCNPFFSFSFLQKHTLFSA